MILRWKQDAALPGWRAEWQGLALAVTAETTREGRRHWSLTVDDRRITRFAGTARAEWPSPHAAMDAVDAALGRLLACVSPQPLARQRSGFDPVAAGLVVRGA